MKVYKIERWDSISPPGSSNSLPMIYISADPSLIKYAQKNNYSFEVEIKGTNSIYDGKKIMGTFDSLLLGPNYESKEILNKNWHTIILTSYFYQYPPLMGEVIIPNLTEKKVSFNPIVKVKNYEENSPPVSMKKKSDLIGMNTFRIIFVLTLIFLILVLIFFLFKKHK